MTYFTLGLDILILLLGLSLLLCFARLYLGEGTPNRTVAFDLIAVHAVGVITLFAIRSDARVLLDAAIITTILGFVGTVMFALYLERSKVGD